MKWLLSGLMHKIKYEIMLGTGTAFTFTPAVFEKLHPNSHKQQALCFVTRFPLLYELKSSQLGLLTSR
jgi:hypothetical protein